MSRVSSRQHFQDGSSLNPEINTVTFALTLPLPFVADGETMSCTKSILTCLARSIETSKNTTVQTALKEIFDLIHERALPEERAYFPNWFDSQ